MENLDLHPMIILKLKKIHQCKKCFRKLQKKLLEVNGVNGVSIDEVNRLVSIRGKADPTMLIKSIEENGNAAELFSYEKEPNRKKKKKYHSQSETENSDNGGNRKEKKSFSFWKFHNKKKKEEEHKNEDYIPLKIDPEVCRDPFCKIHKRRPVITSRVPSRDNENHPHHTGGGFFPGAYHHLFNQTNPSGFQYRYNNAPPQMFAAPPPPQYGGFYSRRPWPAAQQGFNFYGNGNPGNCSTM